MDEQSKQMIIKMGEHLADARPQLLVVLMSRYGLTPHDAEDVYGDTVIYMIKRGWQLIDMDQSFGAAVMNTLKRRALNHIRNRRRMNHIYVQRKIERDHLADTKDWVGETEASIDEEAIITQLKAAFADDAPTLPVIHHLFDSDLSMTELGIKTGFNKNTLHGAKRRVRQYMRKHYVKA